MKTYLFIIALFVPLFLNGQSSFNSASYPIIAKGDNWINQGFPDSALIYAKEVITNEKSNGFNKNQAYYIAGKSSLELGEADNAIPFFYKSIALAEKNKHQKILLHSKIALSKVTIPIYTQPL